VYGAIGFINRLAYRARLYSRQIRKEVLSKYMDEHDADTFHLSFSGVIQPVWPRANQQTVLQNSYQGLKRAKADKVLMVVFEREYETPSDRQHKLKEELMKLNGTGNNDKMQELDRKIKLLKEASEIFSVSPSSDAA
jgi:hypothetical protein